MDIAHLRAFYAVAMTGSVTAAANQLHRVPSSITTRIHQLEEEFDQQLFLRVKNRLEISPAGHRLMNYAEPLLAMFEQTERMMREYCRDENIALGALDVAIETYLTGVIGSFRERHPKVRLAVRQAPSEILRDELIKGKLDIILNDGPVEALGFDTRRAFQERLVLITDKSYADVTSSLDLENVDIYGFRRNCSYRLKMDQWLKEGGLLSPNIIEMESYAVILACVSGGSGAAWIPETLLNMMDNKRSVKVHDLGDYGNTDLYFSWRTDGVPSIIQDLINSTLEAIEHTRS